MIRYYLGIGSVFLVLFFMHRMLFLGMFDPISSMEIADFARIAFTGLRFDLMVFAYICIPGVIFALLGIISSDRVKKFFWWLHKPYFSLMIFASSLITYLDLVWMKTSGDRLNQQFPWAEVGDYFKVGGHWVITISVLTLVGIACIFALFRMDAEKAEIADFRSWITTLVLLLVVGRGSLGPHHLDLEFAQISQSPGHNLAVVPSWYALDQAIHNRR